MISNVQASRNLYFGTRGETVPAGCPTDRRLLLDRFRNIADSTHPKSDPKDNIIPNLMKMNDLPTKEQLLQELEKSNISCKNVTFTILGLSLATINTFVSLFFSLITMRKFYIYEKK